MGAPSELLYNGVMPVANRDAAWSFAEEEVNFLRKRYPEYTFGIEEYLGDRSVEPTVTDGEDVWAVSTYTY